MKLLKQKFIYPEQGFSINSCHASTLAAFPGGDILAAWFGGEGEGSPDVEIWSSRLSGGVWSEPERLSVPSDTACWNPVLYSSGNDAILFFKRGDKIFRRKTIVRRSRDCGRSWSDETELVAGDVGGGRGPVKNKPILLTDGTLLAPASHESEDKQSWLAFTDRSRDGGYSWTRGEYIKTEPYVKLIQPTLWESGKGRVHMLLRSAGGFIYRADSDDYGLSWGNAYPTSLPNNNSGIDLVRAESGELLLVCNPVSGNWGKRSPLVAISSSDNGESWSEPLILAEGEGEYSYPSVIYSGGLFYVTFTWRRKTIAFCEITL